MIIRGAHIAMNEFVDSVHQTIIQIIFFSTHTQTLHSFSKEFAFALILLSRFHVKLHFISFENDIKLDFIFLHLMGKNVQNWPLYLQQFFQNFLRNSSKSSMYLYIGAFF